MVEPWTSTTKAEAALGRLDGVGRLLPNPYLLTRPYLLREAISSTRIEGTQASMADVYEVDAAGGAPTPDVEEVLGTSKRCDRASSSSTHCRSAPGCCARCTAG